MTEQEQHKVRELSGALARDLPQHVRAAFEAEKRRQLDAIAKKQAQAEQRAKAAQEGAARQMLEAMLGKDAPMPGKEADAPQEAGGLADMPGKPEAPQESEAAGLADFTPKEGQKVARVTVSRRLYLEARRTVAGVSRRWWYRIPKTQGRSESRLSLGAFPKVTQAQAMKKAARLLADEEKGRDVAAMRTGRPVAGASDAFRAQFVEAFREAAPACYDFAADSAAPTPWCAPWTWAKVQEWALPGLTAAEQGRAWAERNRAEMVAVFARREE